MTETYIQFELIDSTGKTNRWQAQTKDNLTVLGSVHWFGRWRCYAFFPLQGTVYERKCLRDIADFCEAETKKWRDAKKAKP